MWDLRVIFSHRHKSQARFDTASVGSRQRQSAWGAPAQVCAGSLSPASCRLRRLSAFRFGMGTALG